MKKKTARIFIIIMTLLMLISLTGMVNRPETSERVRIQSSAFLLIDPHFGRTGSVATGVSDDGSVVVGYSINGQGGGMDDIFWERWDFNSQRAFRWTSTTGTQDLGSLGLERTWAHAVSGNGRVVVGAYYTGSYAWRPYRWTPEAGMQDLGTFGRDWSDALDVSFDGSAIAGYSYGYCGNIPYWGVFAWRWTASTGLVCLGTISGYKFTHGLGISGDGNVVVGLTNKDWAPAWHESEAWIWTSGSGMRGLGVLSGWQSSSGMGVSADGTTVIGVLHNDYDYESFWRYPHHAFRWRADTGMQDLGTLGGNMSAVSHAVTGDGRIVFGRSKNSAGEWRAFRWTPERGMEDLNTVYASLIPSGWTLREVTDCSVDGRYLVGWAEGPGGVIRAFRLDTGTGGGVEPTVSTLMPESSAEDPLHRVVLKGLVDPKGGTVQVWFEWGTDPNLTTYQIAGTQTVAGSAQTVRATLSLPEADSIGVVYYYRVAAGSPANPQRGQIEPFLILLGLPKQSDVDVTVGVTHRPYWNKFDRLIHYYAHQRNIPPTLVKAIIAHESYWNKSNNEKPEHTFLYEPISIDWNAIQNKTLPRGLEQYLLPNNPPPEGMTPYSASLGKYVSIKKATKILDMVGLCWIEGSIRYNYCYIDKKRNKICNCKIWRDNVGAFTPTWQSDLNYYNDIWTLTNPSPPKETLTDSERVAITQAVAQYRLASSYGLGHVLYRYHYDRAKRLKGTSSPPPPEDLWDPEFNIKVMVDYLNEHRNKCAPSSGEKNYNDITVWEGTARAYNGHKCNVGYTQGDAWTNITKFFKYAQPALAHRGNLGSVEAVKAVGAGILSPSPQALRAAHEESLLQAGEYEVDRLVADLKGTGQGQLATLIAVVSDPNQGVAYGVLRVFRDAAGTSLEWESPPMEGVLASGVVLTSTIPGGGAPLVIAYWGAGAHGVRAYLYRWDGQTFQPIRGKAQDGTEFTGFFGDAGVDIRAEGIWTGSRDGTEPLGVLHFDHYSWNPIETRFEWVGESIIDLREFRVYLPLVMRNYR
jgi:probable HAF family extracellular repeat protein